MNAGQATVGHPCSGISQCPRKGQSAEDADCNSIETLMIFIRAGQGLQASLRVLHLKCQVTEQEQERFDLTLTVR